MKRFIKSQTEAKKAVQEALLQYLEDAGARDPITMDLLGLEWVQEYDKG